MVNTIIIRTNGDVDEISINDHIDVDEFEFLKVKPFFKKIGKGDIERQCDWEIDEYKFSIFGWKEGKENIINKFELPPPEDTDLYYGDIILFRLFSDNVINCSKEEFEIFYEASFGGFEDLGDHDTSDDDDDDENEYDFNDDFLVPDNEPVLVDPDTSTSESEFDFENNDDTDDDEEDEDEDEEDEDEDEDDEEEEDEEEEDEEEEDEEEEEEEDEEDEEDEEEEDEEEEEKDKEED